MSMLVVVYSSIVVGSVINAAIRLSKLPKGAVK